MQPAAARLGNGRTSRSARDVFWVLGPLPQHVPIRRFPVILTQSGLPLRENLALQNTVYRIVQESLTNALRYAENPTAVTEIVGDREKLHITVTDDG